MNKAAVLQSLENIKRCYSSVIMSTNIFQDGEVVSWFNYKSGIIKGVSYPREYQLLLDQGQYSFLMVDSSFFQFYFNFNNDELTSCRMAFYPIPKFINESYEDLAEYEENANPWLKDIYLEMALELEYQSGSLSANSHVRFDFDNSVNSHSKSHLQFGGINDFRIPARSIVLPFAFFEKIISDFHPEWFVENFNTDKTSSERTHSVNNRFQFAESDVYFIES